jgi:phosphoribosyl-AMP cyclohydrolase
VYGTGKFQERFKHKLTIKGQENELIQRVSTIHDDCLAGDRWSIE